MIPSIFHLTAPTKSLSWEERQIQARLRKLLPGWEGHLWDDADNSALMKKVFPQYAPRFEAIRFGVMKADIARYAYMHAYGGFYFDTDYKLFKPISGELMQQNCVLPIEEGVVGSADFKLGNAVFGSAQGHPLWAAFIDHLFTQRAPDELEDHRAIPGLSGPRGLTVFYLENQDRFTDVVFPSRNEFHPDRTWGGISHRGGEQAFGSHLCWASWRGKSMRRAVTNYIRRKVSAPL
ncbi:MAG TPA: glycosyltransferase [Rhizobacter sp.]|nr:glycosyltransferase [Rhizobacter sp.]